MSDARRGFGLVEVLVAMAVLAVLGGALLTLSRASVRSSARASELQLATVLAARSVDQLLCAGYRRLAEEEGKERPLDMKRLAPDAGATTLVADGFVYQGRVAIERAKPGLLRLVVTLDWRREGSKWTLDTGSLTVLRFVADPGRALDL